jgi:Asp/Glu/hydantoin racemase
MRRLLVINPNTSVAVSELLQLHASKAAGSDVLVTTLTAQFGAPYIACESSYAVAGHAALDTWAQALAQPGPRFDAVLIGCFGDPGLMALRECSSIAVTGLAEASFIAAARQGRFAVVTGGARWKPMLERLAHALGFADSLAGVHTVSQSGAELARDPVAARTILTQACNEAAQRFQVGAVVLGGAGLAGVAQQIAANVSVPVIDSVEAGVRHALSDLDAVANANDHFDFAWTLVSPALATLGTSMGAAA